MKHSGNIFKTGNCRGPGKPSFSGVQILTIILSVISFIAAIFIIANFGTITAKIAVGIVNLLSTGLLIFIAVIAVIILIGRWRWGMRRRFWDW